MSRKLYSNIKNSFDINGFNCNLAILLIEKDIDGLICNQFINNYNKL